MARISKIQQEMNYKFERDVTPEQPNEQDIRIKELQNQIDVLFMRLNDIESQKNVVRKSTINRVEVFNGEVETTPDTYRGINMTAEDRLISMRNAAKILPPNLIENGRHIKENIQAICGFVVDEDMMDAMYTGFKHEE